MVNVNETNLAKYVHDAIFNSHLSLRKAAKKVGVSAAYLSKLINHKANSNPKPSTLKKMADGLKISYTNMCKILGYDTRKQRVIDLKQAIDNDDYLTFGGRPISKEEKIFVKRMLDGGNDDN
ncbi:helix-turn-helix domain-containing protein [Acetilactobacillus jinshanensis]|uniref:helix-turn-helix domain-containing protein n=1 Tax=Acetilactobacillus jinshanensis TaxID=1720083 RepID=UPI0013A600F7|nr:helix-turn-helix domain-containing protein [Acetilactobacillus jinshanensis]URL60924.1 helix-turn-helix transcriptional regulator [uncultured bacterium]